MSGSIAVQTGSIDHVARAHFAGQDTSLPRALHGLVSGLREAKRPWSEGGRTVVERGLHLFDAVRRAGGTPHFVEDSGVFPVGVRLTPEYMDGFYGKNFSRKSVHVNLPEAGWNGKLGYRDSAPQLAGRTDVATVVFTHGLMCYADMMWADIIKWLFEAFHGQERVRFIVIDYPGHAGSDKPFDFSYDFDPLCQVMSAALTNMGVAGRYTHVTQSLGYIQSMWDVNSGRFQINRHINYGTSPEQLGFVLGTPWCRSRSLLGGKTLLETAIEKSPEWFINYETAIQTLLHAVGSGAPRQIMEAFAGQMRDPAATHAWFRMLHDGVHVYMDEGHKMYGTRLPERMDPIEMVFIAGTDDVATPIAGVRRHAQLLRENPAFDITFIPTPGNHFAMGRGVVFREKMFQMIRDGVERDLFAAVDMGH